MKSQNLSIKSQHIKGISAIPVLTQCLNYPFRTREEYLLAGIIHIHLRPKLTKVLAGALCRQTRHYIFINSSNGSKHCSRQASRQASFALLRGKSEKLGADATVYGRRRWPRQLHFRLCRWRQGEAHAAQIAALTTPLGLLLLTGYQSRYGCEDVLLVWV